MAGLKYMQLSGRNAIELWFGRKEFNWAVYFYLKHLIFIGHWQPGRRSHNSGHTNAFTLAASGRQR
jgi:hypothetical protein